MRSLLPAAVLRAALVLSIASPFVCTSNAHAQPTLGFIENWSVDESGWAGGAQYLNPGTGGVGGAGDGYLVMFTGSPAKLGTVSFGAEYSGDWVAAGITQVRVWLNDVGTDDPLQIHLGVGSSANFWHSNIGFSPPLHQWQEFVYDLTAANFTRIRGTGTFDDALKNTDRLHFRHDVGPPFDLTPELIQADVGIDRVLLTNGVVGVTPTPTVSAPIELGPGFPNPARGAVAFALRSAGEAVRIQIVDAAGRSVRRADLPSFEGRRVWMWDGRDDGGRPTAPGVYVVRAHATSGDATRSVVRRP